MIFKRMLRLIAIAALPAAVLCQNLPNTAPIRNDPLEMVTGPIQVATTPEERETALKLLTRARSNYALGGATVAYNLKASFTVDSAGQTQYDGAWEMEQTCVPKQGTHWSATSPLDTRPLSVF